MSKRDGDMRTARAAMVEEIAAEVLVTRKHLDKDALDARVMAAMGTVARHAFIPKANRSSAYVNRPQPIGHGQTISQPYMVAIMTDLAAVAPTAARLPTRSSRFMPMPLSLTVNIRVLGSAANSIWNAASPTDNSDWVSAA